MSLIPFHSLWYWCRVLKIIPQMTGLDNQILYNTRYSELKSRLSKKNRITVMETISPLFFLNFKLLFVLGYRWLTMCLWYQAIHTSPSNTSPHLGWHRTLNRVPLAIQYVITGYPYWIFECHQSFRSDFYFHTTSN